MKSNIRDSIIKQVIVSMINRANAKFDMQEILKQYSAEDRTMNIVINDIDDGYGFSVNGEKLVMSSVENPTCTVSMDKKTFSAIATGKISQSQAFFMGLVEIVGDNWLRDSVVLNKIFDELKDAMLKRSR